MVFSPSRLPKNTNTSDDSLDRENDVEEGVTNKLKSTDQSMKQPAILSLNKISTGVRPPMSS